MKEEKREEEERRRGGKLAFIKQMEVANSGRESEQCVQKGVVETGTRRIPSGVRR